MGCTSPRSLAEQRSVPKLTLFETIFRSPIMGAWSRWRLLRTYLCGAVDAHDGDSLTRRGLGYRHGEFPGARHLNYSSPGAHHGALIIQRGHVRYQDRRGSRGPGYSHPYARHRRSAGGGWDLAPVWARLTEHSWRRSSRQLRPRDRPNCTPTLLLSQRARCPRPRCPTPGAACAFHRFIRLVTALQVEASSRQ